MPEKPSVSRQADIVRAALVAGDDISLEELQEALATTGRARPWRLGIDRHEAIGIIEGNLGNAFRREAGDEPEKLETALRWFRRSLRSFQRSKAGIKIGYAHLNLAAAYELRIAGHEQDSLDTALDHYRAALRIFCDEGEPRDLADAHRSIARLYLKRPRDRKGNLRRAIAQYERLIADVGHNASMRPSIERELDELRQALTYEQQPPPSKLLDKPRPRATSAPIGPDKPMFFTATVPPVATEATHHLAPNLEFDRPGINRQAGFEEHAQLFTAGVTGVREGYENAMRVLVTSNNAMFETDVERRLTALKQALDFRAVQRS